MDYKFPTLLSFVIKHRVRMNRRCLKITDDMSEKESLLHNRVARRDAAAQCAHSGAMARAEQLRLARAQAARRRRARSASHPLCLYHILDCALMRWIPRMCASGAAARAGRVRSPLGAAESPHERAARALQRQRPRGGARATRSPVRRVPAPLTGPIEPFCWCLCVHLLTQC